MKRMYIFWLAVSIMVNDSFPKQLPISASLIKPMIKVAKRGLEQMLQTPDFTAFNRGNRI